jgi:predicted nucleotidyltransferase
MLEELFSSKARIEILKLFLFNPETRYYMRQISKLSEQSIRGVQREIEKLKKIGLLEESIEGNRNYYQVNKNCAIYEELKRIFLKTVGFGETLRKHLERTKDIKIAFIYGSFARGEENASSDIDLLVIGSISAKKLSGLLSKPKKELGREVNYAVYSIQECRKRIREKDHFLKEVLGKEKIFLIGNDEELKAIA